MPESATMGISDIPILSMLRTRMEFSQQRQRVLAENVANADTPQYRAKDLVAPKFENNDGIVTGGIQPVALVQTVGGHIAGIGQDGAAFKSESKGQFDVRPTGNAVSLEDQMMKVAANQMEYAAATALYTRSLNLLKTALGKR
jgi:flagellar basal-body rod protein FlgB